MRKQFALIPALFMLLLAPTTDAARGPDPKSIFTQQTKDSFELTVPASKLVASIPRGDLVMGRNPSGEVENARYFFLEDEARQMIISGWFEPEQAFPGLKELWARDTAKWKSAGLPAPLAVSFARISDWEAVLYDMQLAAGSNSHIRAHWVQAGTWLDLHLSITSDRSPAENRRNLKSVLKAIRVRQKE